LLAALHRLKNVSHLILYEPPLNSRRDANTILAKMDRALAENDHEQIVTTCFLELFLMPPEGLPREMRVANSYRASAEWFSVSKIPITALLGTETQGLLRDTAFFLAMPFRVAG
jgi:hypothetical protein